jgi:hypothetical protein
MLMMEHHFEVTKLTGNDIIDQLRGSATAGFFVNHIES